MKEKLTHSSEAFRNLKRNKIRSDLKRNKVRLSKNYKKDSITFNSIYGNNKLHPEMFEWHSKA